MFPSSDSGLILQSHAYKLSNIFKAVENGAKHSLVENILLNILFAKNALLKNKVTNSQKSIFSQYFFILNIKCFIIIDNNLSLHLYFTEKYDIDNEY